MKAQLGILVVALLSSLCLCDDYPDTAPCPRGKYRKTSFGMRQGECIWCPRGKYGSTEGLTSSACSGKCPLGKYNDRLGATTEEDCHFCPPGRYGAKTGLETQDCSGWCDAGTYSSAFGLTTLNDCVDCPVGYRGWQCSPIRTSNIWLMHPRRGYWDTAQSGTDGKINEDSHAYIDGGSIPQGASQVTFDYVYTPLENAQFIEEE